MKIIYNKLIPFPGFTAMMLFGVIFARKSARPLSERTIRHESIHVAQAKECGGFIPYYLKYLAFWVRYGYKMNPFEQDAYYYNDDSDWRFERPYKFWKNWK